jgi:hypothetical protein
VLFWALPITNSYVRNSPIVSVQDILFENKAFYHTNKKSIDPFKRSMPTHYSTLSSAAITQLIAPVMTKAITTMNIFPTPLDRPFYLLRIYHIFTVFNFRECEHFVNKHLALLSYFIHYDIILDFFVLKKRNNNKLCIGIFSYLLK